MNRFLSVVVITLLCGCSVGDVESNSRLPELYEPVASFTAELSSDDKWLIDHFCFLDSGMNRDDVVSFMKMRPSRSWEHEDVWETSVARLVVKYQDDHESVDFLEAEFIEKNFDFPCDWLRG